MSDKKKSIWPKLMNRYSGIIVGLALLLAFIQFVFSWPATEKPYYTYVTCFGALILAFFIRPIMSILSVLVALGGLYLTVQYLYNHKVNFSADLTWGYIIMVIGFFLEIFIRLVVPLLIAGLFFRLGSGNDFLNKIIKVERAEAQERRERRVREMLHPEGGVEPEPSWWRRVHARLKALKEAEKD